MVIQQLLDTVSSSAFLQCFGYQASASDTAYVILNGVWFHCDDSNVSEASVSEIDTLYNQVGLGTMAAAGIKVAIYFSEM